MLSLTEPDIGILRGLASGIAEPADVEDTTQKLRVGYETYGSEELIGAQSREAFFKATYAKLLANLRYAGHKSEEVFTEARPHIENILARLKVPVRDVADVAQTAIIKMWKHKYAEGYNPIVASWSHYLYVALSRAAASYFAGRKREVLAQSFHYQQYENASLDSGEELCLEPYEADQGMTPQDRMILTEVLKDFEGFLEKQKPYRAGVLGKHKSLCTLQPGGEVVKSGETAQVRITEPVTAYLVRKSDMTTRVEMMDGVRPSWKTSHVADIRPNPDHGQETQETVTVERTPLILYRLLMDRGAQIAEIALELKVAQSTAHNWIRDLEVLFQQWFQQTPHIRQEVRHLAVPVQKCPGCGFEHEVTKKPARRTKRGHRVTKDGAQYYRASPGSGTEINAHWCSICEEWALDGVIAVIELPPPWGKIRGDHDLVERSNKYKTKLEIPLCGL